MMVTSAAAIVPGSQAGTNPVDRLARLLTRLSRPRAHLINGAAILLVVALDATMPDAFAFGPFYFLCVCLAAWTLGGRPAYAIAGLSAALAVAMQIPEARTGIALLWNVGTRLFANVVVTALIAALRRTYDHERFLGRTDGLTGALNRRAFHDAITALLARARRKGDVLVISYIDLDGFKAVNDVHGHAAGDAVLTAFAEAARAELGTDGALARVGGDEFVLIQVCETFDDLFAAAERRHERLTAALEAMPYGVTCSMGVVIVRGGRTDEEALVAFADALLYEVKRAGKNSLRIAVADAEPEGAAA